MQRSQHPFNGLEQGPDFDRARSMIATPFQYVDIALDVAGVNQIFNVSGDFLYADASSTGVATLELNNQYNDPAAPFYVQSGFGINALFKQIKLSWSAQVGKRLRLMYSTGDRIVPTNSTSINGIVNTVDGALSRTLANQAFLSYLSSGPVAAQYPHCQMWNPPASGRNLYIESLLVSSGTAGIVYIADHNAALPTAGSVFSKYSGSAAGVGLAKTTTNAALQYVAMATAFYVGVNVPQVINFREPLLIPPGRGLNVLGGAVNAGLLANFEWYEQ